jgi:hypothetical protein
VLDDALFGRFWKLPSISKKEPEAFSLRLKCAMVVFFMGRIVPVSGPVAQQDFGRWTFGRRVMQKLLVVLDERQP